MCVDHCFEKTLYYTSPGHGGWGIIRIAALVPQSHLMFICPSACFRHGALGAIQHGYKDRTSYLYIMPSDVVTGYDEIIMEGAKELLDGDEGIRVLFLFVACVDDFIGTDMDAVAKRVERQHPGVIVRACHMNPVAAETAKPPLVTCYQKMFSAIPAENRAAEKAVNLLGSFAPVDRECELFGFLDSCGGYQVRQLADYESFDAFCGMGRSLYNLVLMPGANFTAQFMDDTYGTRSLVSLISYDMEEIAEGYHKLALLLAGDEAGAKRLAAQFDFETVRQETIRSIRKAQETLGGMPVVVSDSAVLRPFSLARALLSYGFWVEEVIAQEVVGADRPAYEALCKEYPQLRITQPQHHRSAILQKGDTRMVGIGFEGAYLRQCDYVADLSGDEGMYGYYGVRRLMRMLERAVEQKADLKYMIEEYGAVV